MYQYPKTILTIQQQIQSYIDAGMDISSLQEVEEAMRTIGYYRLRGYSFQLYDNISKKYKAGTKFRDILKLYYFDQRLSNLIFFTISKIEVALRARLVETLLEYGDALILQDSSIFKDKKKYWQNMSIVSSEIARSNDLFIKHNFNKYEGEVPIWAVVEIISFGTLSKLIKNLKTGPDGAYAKLAENYKYISIKGNMVKPSQKMLTSWVQAITILRNICAHNSRIYNRTIHTTPEILIRDRISPKPAHNGLYQIILAMKYLKPTDREWKEFMGELKKLFKDNEDVISLETMNFPKDWEQHLSI